MIYEKSGFPFPTHTRYYPVFEYMFVWVKGNLLKYNPIKDRQNVYAGKKVARKHGSRKADGIVHPNTAMLIDPERIIKNYGVRTNIWRITSSSSKGDKEALKHPATFPEQLAHDHIISWSNEGDTVLDPMMGSGTTGKMAKQLNRNFIGIEIEKSYYDIAENRINAIML